MNDNYSIGKSSLTTIFDENTCYTVPDYQRSYEWKKHNVEQLWEDLMHDYMNNPQNKSDEYLLGPIVITHQQNEEVYYIVDGQQRLVTLILLFCAIRESLQEYMDKKESDRDKTTIKVFLLDINKLILNQNEGRIKLNGISNDVFRDIQQNKTNIEKLKQIRKQENHAPTKKLIDNYNILMTDVKVLCEKCNLESNNDDLAEAIQTLRQIICDIKDKNFFVHVNVQNADYAHQVFESLNSKGQSLNQADLIKSHLLKKSGHDQTEISNKWQQIIEEIKDKNPDNLLYESLLSRTTIGNDIRKKDLYKHIKEFKNNKDTIHAYLQELKKDSIIIQSLDYPDERSNPPPIAIQHLFYGIKQIRAKYIRRPIITACREWGYQDQRTESLIDCLLKFFFMYRTIGKGNLDKLRAVSKEVTQQIIDKKEINVIFWTILKNDSKSGVVDNVNEKDFLKNFKDKIHDLQQEIAKYILFSIEHELNKSGGIVPNIVGGKFELEHIFPKNPKTNCKDSNKLLEYVNRLGNLTLLPSDWNNFMSNNCFEDKKNGSPNNESHSYSKSGLKLNEQYLKNYDEWTLDNLYDREEKICKLVPKIWSVSDYSAKAKKST